MIDVSLAEVQTSVIIQTGSRDLAKIKKLSGFKAAGTLSSHAFSPG